MFNYIAAELYKALHRRYLWIMMLCLLAGEALLVFIEWLNLQEGAHIDFAACVQLVPRMLPMGFLAGVLAGDLVFAAQDKHGTLKNEVSFGLPRTMIYLGKLISMAIVSVGILLVAMLFYCLVCFVMFDHSVGAADVVNYLGISLMGGLPLWLGTLGLYTMTAFLLGSTAAGLLNIAFYFTGGLALELLILLAGGLPYAGKILVTLYQWFPTEVINSAYMIAVPEWTTLDGLSPGFRIAGYNWDILQKCWVCGLFWIAVPTILGLVVFHRKEVK